MNGAPTAATPTWVYDDLVREGMSLIPAHAPEWTNHNASDPGITLIELLAYFSELLAYRLGRVTPEAKLQFLRLLEGAGAGPREPIDPKTVDQSIARRIEAMSRGGCLVTAADFERAAVDAVRAELGPDARVRAVCIVGADLRRRLHGERRRRSDMRAHVGVVLLPAAELAPGAMSQLCATVQRSLAELCLLTTTVHVVGPTLVHLALGFRLALRPGAQPQAVLDAVAARLRGPEAPCTAAVRITDITELIDNSDGVDHVEDVVISASGADADGLARARAGIGVQIAVHSTPGIDTQLGPAPPLDARRLDRDDAGRLAAIRLEPWEMARLHIEQGAVEIIEADRRGPDGRGAQR